jgi:hypothetical protein
MPDARLHFRSPAWQSLPVAGLPPASWPEPARRLRLFFRSFGRLSSLIDLQSVAWLACPRAPTPDGAVCHPALSHEAEIWPGGPT